MMNLYLNMITQDVDNKHILEPFCVIFRLILLNYKPVNTKLSILNNSIFYTEPSFYQGFMRNYYGATRDDLHNLYMPLLKSMEWNANDSEVNKYLFTNCIKGIGKLIKSYDNNSIINHTLIHYKVILQEYLDNGKYMNASSTSPIVNSLQNFWSKHEIFIAYNIIKEINQTNDSESKDVYCRALECILELKEKKIQQLIHRNSTQYN
jgi:hypothetical protein